MARKRLAMAREIKKRRGEEEEEDGDGSLGRRNGMEWNGHLVYWVDDDAKEGRKEGGRNGIKK